jgi:hypothetical protein
MNVVIRFTSARSSRRKRKESAIVLTWCSPSGSLNFIYGMYGMEETKNTNGKELTNT